MIVAMAGDYGAGAVADLINRAFWVASIISVTSVLFALPKALRAKARWHGWAALISAITFLAFSVYLLSKFIHSWDRDVVLPITVFCLPLVLAFLSLLLSRRKNA